MRAFFVRHRAFILIMILALLLRVNLLFFRGDFSFDEFFSWHFGTLPSWSDTLKYWILETNPPLYTLLIRFWVAIFGADVLILRIPSLIFGLAGVAMVYLFTQKFFSRTSASVATFLYAITVGPIEYSVENRVYSLLAFLAILSFYFFQLISTQTNVKTKIFGWYLLVQVVLLYSHLTSLLIPATQIFLAFDTKPKNQGYRKKIIRTNLLSLLLFAPWFLISVKNKLNFGSANGWFFNFTDIYKESILNTIIELFITIPMRTLVFYLLIGLIIFLIWRAFLIYKNTEKFGFIIVLAAWAVVPLATSAAIGMHAPKYVAFGFPAICILLGLGLDSLVPKVKSVVLLAITAIILPSAMLFSFSPILTWQPYTEYISRQATEDTLIFAVPFSDSFIFSHYYQGPGTIVGAYPLEDDLSLDEKIVRYNWQYLVVDLETHDRWMESITKNKDRVFVLNASNHIGRIAPQWLLENGWKLLPLDSNVNRATTKFRYGLLEFYAPTDN